MKNEIVSVGKIAELFQLSREPNNIYEANVILQVVAFSHNVSENKSFYSFTLSDSIHKYAGFIYLKDQNAENQNFEANDLIRLKKFSVTELTNKGNKVIFIVKEVDYYGKVVELLGTPEEFKEKTIAEREMKKSHDEILSLYTNSMGFNTQSGNKSSQSQDQRNGNMEGNLNGNSSGYFGFPPILQAPNLGFLNPSNSLTSLGQLNQSPVYPFNGINFQQQQLSQFNGFGIPLEHQNGTTGKKSNTKYVPKQKSKNLKKKNIEVTPLNKLSTYSKNFTIQVRILKKTELISYRKNENNGVLMSFNVLDSSGVEMEVKAFNATAEKAFHEFKENCVYKIYGLYVKMNDKRYSSIKSDFYLILEDYYSSDPVEDDSTIMSINFKFVKIKQLSDITVGTTVDIISIIIEEGNLHAINTKHGEREIKRIKIGDDSEYETELSLWGEHSHIDFGLFFDESSEEEKNGSSGQKSKHNLNLSSINPETASKVSESQLQSNTLEKNAREKNIIVAAFKNVYISEFNGSRNLNTTSKSAVYLNPKIKEAETMKKFFLTFSGELKSINLPHKEKEPSHKDEVFDDKVSTFHDIINYLQHSAVGFSEKGRVFKAKACVVDFIHSDKNFYIGCSECRRKCKESEDKYQCYFCKKDFDHPNFIYSFLFKAKDVSGECFLDVIGEVGNVLLGRIAEEYKITLESCKEQDLKSKFPHLERTEFYFYIKPKVNYFNGENRKKLSVIKAEPVQVDLRSTNIGVSSTLDGQAEETLNIDTIVSEASKEKDSLIARKSSSKEGINAEVSIKNEEEEQIEALEENHDELALDINKSVDDYYREERHIRNLKSTIPREGF